MNFDSNDDVIVLTGENEFTTEMRSLTIGDFNKISVCASVLLGFANDLDPAEIGHEIEVEAAEFFVEKVLERFDLKATREDSLKLLVFMCSLLTHVAGTVYGNAQMLSHALRLDGAPLTPIDAISLETTTPPAIAMAI